MAKKILIGAAVFFVCRIVGFVVIVALQPSTFAIERSATFAAPIGAIFPEINDLKAWDAWSPWAELDPNATITISSPSAGKGAKFAWVGNDQVGEGSLTIVETKPDELVVVEQEFVKPMSGKARMAFILAPAESETKVTWKMDGTNDFFAKAICMFMDMDAMLGPNFEKGLASMKAVVENKFAAPVAAP